jgi:GNAT superfamily N-acetyltransferase
VAIDTQSALDALRRLDRTAASREASWHLRDGTLVWPRFAQPPSACEEGAEILVEDADRRVVGRAAYRRVYGPRAVLSLAAADRYWRLGLPEALLDEALRLAELGGISTLLLRTTASDARMLALLCDDRGAPARRDGDGDHVDIELALRHDHGGAGQPPAA